MMGFLTKGCWRRPLRHGMTLIEVVMAIAIVVLLTGSLMVIGMKARQYTEHLRLAAEARILAKAKMEELVAYGASTFAMTGATFLVTTTNLSSRGYPIVRSPIVVWHSADGLVVSPTNAAYAEVHVTVSYPSPFSGNWHEDTLVTILEKEPGR